MELSEARAQWRGLETKAFLDAACCSIIPQPTKRTLIEFIEMCEICPQESSSGGAPSTRAAPLGGTRFSNTHDSTTSFAHQLSR